MEPHMRMNLPVRCGLRLNCGRFRLKFRRPSVVAPKRPNSGLTFDKFPVKSVWTFGAEARRSEQSRNS
jgi:hypothetical protein